MIADLNDAGHLILQLPVALSAKKLEPREQFGVRSLMQGLSTRTSRLATQLEKTAKELATFYASTGRERNVEDVVENFEATVYRAAELFELLSDDLPKLMREDHRPAAKFARDKYKPSIRRLRNEWSLICNKIKHESNALHPVSAYSDVFPDATVGYSLNRPAGGDSLVINSDLHKKGERSRTMLLELHQLVHDIVAADQAASSFIIGLPDDGPSDHPDMSVAVTLGENILSLPRMPEICLEYSKRRYDRFDLIGKQLVFSKFTARPPRPSCVHIALFKADGFTRIFTLP